MKTLSELKSHAYDCIAQLELAQKNLKEANQAIIDYKEEVVVEKTSDAN